MSAHRARNASVHTRALETMMKLINLYKRQLTDANGPGLGEYAASASSAAATLMETEIYYANLLFGWLVICWK